MKEFFKDILSEEGWLICENGFNPDRMGAYETLFTLGNGSMCSRGVLEEIPYDSSPGTYIAGVFDKSISQVAELVNVPNPVDLRIIAEGEKIDIKGMYLHKHQRILDMKKGLLSRHTVLANSRKERFDYQSLRFLSSHDKHTGAMRIVITPLDAPAILTVQDNINVSVRNKGVLTEGRKKHFQIREVRNEKSINYICAKTQDTAIFLASATHLTVAHNGREYSAPDQSFDVRLKKGETLTLTKIFYGRTSRHLSLRRLRDTTIKALRKKVNRGFNALLSKQVSVFSSLWKESDIIISGDSDAQRSLRFNIYHLLIAASTHEKDVSIGARTLSGEGYRGHVFWDTEIFLTPFYVYNFPAIAKNQLLYRYNRLEAARRIAKEKGFKGVLFPWESADTGEDETPQWHKDLDGTIIEIFTQDYEHHIVADIAYAVDHYYRATADHKFMNRYGAEMLFETARFWASRVSKSARRNKFEIKHVMGPDEFHADVKNNAYTNGMASWNLYAAYQCYCRISRDYKKQLALIADKIHLKKSETEAWRTISENMFIPLSKDKKVIESFEGYFDKQDIVITRFDKHFMPEFPPDLPLAKLQKTQIVKQLDACMLLYLLPGTFNDEVTKNTVNYYEKRTVHKSSLSPAINAIMHLRTHNVTRAYQYFLYALNADLKMYQSNVADGVHAASLGGCWQAVVCGFGGMGIEGDCLSFAPQLPGYWHSLEFNVKWRGDLLNLRMTNNSLHLHRKTSGNKRPLTVKVFGRICKILPGKSITVTDKEE